MRELLKTSWHCFRYLPASVSGMPRCGCCAAPTILWNTLLSSPSFALTGTGISMPRSWATYTKNKAQSYQLQRVSVATESREKKEGVSDRYPRRALHGRGVWVEVIFGRDDQAGNLESMAPGMVRNVHKQLRRLLPWLLVGAARGIRSKFHKGRWGGAVFIERGISYATVLIIRKDNQPTNSMNTKKKILKKNHCSAIVDFQIQFIIQSKIITKTKRTKHLGKCSSQIQNNENENKHSWDHEYLS